VKLSFGIHVVGRYICHKSASKWTCLWLPTARRQNLGSGWDRLHKGRAWPSSWHFEADWQHRQHDDFSSTV